MARDPASKLHVQGLFKNEYAVLENTKATLRDPELSPEALRASHEYLVEKYQLLLMDCVKMTSIGDINQKRLFEAHQKIKTQEKQLREANKELKKREEHLLEANGTIKAHVRKLEELDRAKDEIMGVVAHDLRNPISSVLAVCNFLIEFSEDAAENVKYIHMVESSCNRMLRLIEDLLEVTKLETEDCQIELEADDLGVLIMQVIEGFEKLAASKDIHLHFIRPPISVQAMVSRERFWQICNNLISNSIKFTNPGGEVRVELELKPQRVQVRFIDTGIGISEDMLPILFDKFTDASRQGTKGETSTGLGMFITKRLVDLHNGNIWVTSSVGGGSTFFVELPLDEMNMQAS